MRNTLSLVLTVSLVYGCATTKPPAPAPEAVPSTDEVLSAEISSVLDRDVAACDDFYQFACGGWLDSFELPADRSRYGRSFSAIQDRGREVVRSLLEEPGDGADARLGTYYQACLDAEGAEGVGLTTIQADLDALASAPDGVTLLTTAAGQPLNGAFFDAFVIADFKNPDINMMMVAQGGLGLPTRDHYEPAEDDEDGQAVLAAYEAHVGRMLDLAGLDPAGAADVLAVEKALAAASRRPAELRDATTMYHPMDLAGLKTMAPGMPWEAWLDANGISRDVTLNVLTPEFFPAVATVLAEQPIETLRTYAAWHLITAAAPYLTAAMDTENFAFYGTTLSGQKEQEPRWKRCVAGTDGALGDLLGQAFVDRTFAGDSKAKALTMIEDIEAAFASALPELAWMDDATRDKALEKLHAITNKIGYPDSWESYEGLVVTGDAYANAVASGAWDWKDSLADVGQPVDKAEWGMSPPTVNAYYNPLNNEIVFPAGIMQPPFFSAERPAALNYGAMGMVMGHEITHGFDDEGRKFDPTGKMDIWWDEAVSDAFETEAACVTETYGAIEVQPGVSLNGELTLGENIADFGGIKLANLAFQRWSARQDTRPEGLAGFTPEQLVFLGYAQSWCSVATPEVEKLRAQTDSHSPPRYRVNVPLAHLPAFWEAFSCEPGTPMHAETVCAVW